MEVDNDDGSFWNEIILILNENKVGNSVFFFSSKYR